VQNRARKSCAQRMGKSEAKLLGRLQLRVSPYGKLHLASLTESSHVFARRQMSGQLRVVDARLSIDTFNIAADKPLYLILPYSPVC